jgi:peptidoglycan/xylan/chitin deacetylase (PgdA/CDA1 family)
LKRAWSYRRDAAGMVLHWSGVGRAFELVTRPAGAIILMYHSVAGREVAGFVEPQMRMSPEMFDRQMCFLSRHRRVVSLSKVVQEIVAGTSPAVGTICITFDDGYLDTLTIAAPILEKYKFPATLYLATGYVQRRETQWADVLHWLFGFRTVDRLSIPSVGLQGVSLASPVHRANAFAILHAYLLGSMRDERSRVLGEVERALKPAGRPPRLTLDWDEVRELRHRYPLIEFGGHTRDHIDLRRYGGEVARAQIDGCADDLRRELGIEPQHFSFPYERWSVETREAVIASGWRSAVGEGNRFRIVAGSDRFTMPRVEAPATMTALRFKTSGAYPGALSMLGLAEAAWRP